MDGPSVLPRGEVWWQKTGGTGAPASVGFWMKHYPPEVENAYLNFGCSKTEVQSLVGSMVERLDSQLESNRMSPLHRRSTSAVIFANAWPGAKVACFHEPYSSASGICARGCALRGRAQLSHTPGAGYRPHVRLAASGRCNSGLQMRDSLPGLHLFSGRA